MKFSDESYNIRIVMDTRHYEPSMDELEKLESTLDPLRKPVEKFPVAVLYLSVERHPRSGQFRVKSTLQLSGQALSTGSVQPGMVPAVEQCVRRLVHKLVAYEERLEGTEAKSKHVEGTRHNVIPDQQVDPGAIDAAVREGDYVRFRKLLFMYEGPLQKRIGRWMERFPEIEAQMHEQGVVADAVADIVEEVFLTAFDEYDQRPAAVPFGQWLESLIDPSIKLLSHASDEELDNVSFARTLMETE
jgi:hypothetical protein